MKVNANSLEALEKALDAEDKDLSKGLTAQVSGDALQKEDNDANGGLQKGGDGDEEDDEDEDENEGGEGISKSLAAGNPALAQTIDASEVLSALVDGVDTAMDEMRGAMEKSFATAEHNDGLMARAMLKILSDQRELTSLVKSLGDRLEGLGGQVPQRKGATPAAARQVMEKSINGEGGAGQGAAADPLLDNPALVQELLVKSIGAGKLESKWGHTFDAVGHDPRKLPKEVIDTLKGS